MTTADAVKVGDVIWGRTVAAVTLPDRNDRWDTQVMFEFEDGGLLHVSQNRLIEDYRPALKTPIEAPQYAKLLQENDRLRATLERVRLAGREIVLKSMHGKTIINDGGIMQDDAQKIAEALRGRVMDEDNEGQHTLYAEVGFLTEEEAW